MPTHTQNIVEIKGEPASGGMGSRNDLTLKAAFPGSPLHDMKDEDVRKDFEERYIQTSWFG